MTTWFAVKRGKTHLLVSENIDLDRFPLGRAHCAPFPREKTDTLHKTNEVKASDFCKMCTVGIKQKKK